MAGSTRKKIAGKSLLEPGFKRDLHSSGVREIYGDLLKLDQLLSLQSPIQYPPQRDELLFVIIHQVSELWLKLLYAELSEARSLIRNDDLQTATRPWPAARQSKSS